jgi:hypothetical protein
LKRDEQRLTEMKRDEKSIYKPFEMVEDWEHIISRNSGPFACASFYGHVGLIWFDTESFGLMRCSQGRAL